MDKDNIHTLIDILEENYRACGIENKQKMFLYGLIGELREEYSRLYLEEIRIKQDNLYLKSL